MLRAWNKDFACVATDVDGTLTSEGAGCDAALCGSLSPRACRAVRALARRGVPVILVSGRPLPTIEGLAMYLGLIDRGDTARGTAVIAENGAVVRMNGAVQTLARTPSAVSMAAARSLLRTPPFDACRLTYDNLYRVCDAGVHVPPELLGDFKKQIEKQNPELQAITSNIMSHVVCREVNKARALKYVLDSMKIKKDRVIVFGDADTDMPLFEKFPKSVAVANFFSEDRCKKEKQLPALRTKSPGGAGFAEVVRQLLS
jgi:hydroxymethylpyrimidine pyrophosphatase-like HAD family hydrolase